MNQNARDLDLCSKIHPACEIQCPGVCMQLRLGNLSPIVFERQLASKKLIDVSEFTCSPHSNRSRKHARYVQR